MLDFKLDRLLGTMGTRLPHARLERFRAPLLRLSERPLCKGIVESLVDSLHIMKAQGVSAVTNDDDPMGWDLFGSLLEEQQASLASPDLVPSSNDLYGIVSLPMCSWCKYLEKVLIKKGDKKQ